MATNLHNEALHGFERDREVLVQGTERRNMRCGIVHGAFFHMATAFADPYAIIPLFLAGFTGSRALIGLVVSLVEAAGVLPQIPVASHLRRRPNSAKRLMLAGIWTRCAVWGALAALVLLTPDPGMLFLLLFMVGVSVYSLGSGLAVLPLKRVISGTIAPQHRSSFFGWRLFSGGILAVAAGMIVKRVLSTQGLSWPRNYGLLFLLSFTALFALVTILLANTVFALTIAFTLAGGAMSAMIVGFNGYILELGTPEIRPLLFAMEGTLLFPFYFMPLLGGWLADGYGYTTIVMLGAFLVAAALAVATTLCEPRRGDPSCGPCVLGTGS
jgi:hypothetical protein